MHSSLQSAIERLLEIDKNIRGYGIRVRTRNGTVFLSGIVDTLREKEYLNELLLSIPGVSSVVNDVTISTDGAVNDTSVTIEVAEELQGTPGVDLRHIGAKVKDSVATLVGRSKDRHEIEAARKAAAKARGVKAVKSEVRSKEEERPSLEKVFHSQVQNDREVD